MAATTPTEKRFQDDIEPFPEVPGVFQLDKTHEWWGVAVGHLIQKEEDRCGVWKDEVQNLTIYAGLFSAVVTTFIIESSKALQDSPSDVLLSRIAVALERSANATGGGVSTSSVPDSLLATVTSANKLLNGLWFMSLVLSLSSALLGLVGLQWLREHLRPSKRNVPLKTLPAIVQMQADSLEAYYVPQMFTALPLLLIISIVLFYVGLVLYLWDINHTVAYPSIITISLILSLILYTTVRPGLQGLPSIGSPRFRRTTTKSTPSIPCPYRSPQSWAFLQTVVLLSSVSSFIRRRFYSSIKTSDPLSPTKTMKNWIDWAVAWPRIRDIDQLRSTGDQNSLLQPFCDTTLVFPPIYDTVQALTQVKQDFALMGSDDYESGMVNVLESFDDFLDFQQGSQGFATQLVGYVHDVLEEPCLPLALPRSFISQTDLEHLRIHAKLLFVTAGVNNLNDLDASMPGSMVDILPDLLRLTCEKYGTKINMPKPSGSPVAIAWYNATRQSFGDTEGEEEDLPKGDFDYIKELAGIVNRTIEYASKGDVEDDPQTFGTSPYVKTLLHAIANMMVDRASISHEFEFQKETIELIDEALTNIKHHLQNQTHQNPYLFLISSIYAHFLLVKVSPLFMHDPVYVRTKAYNKAAQILKRHHAELHDSAQLRQYQRWIFPKSLEPGFTWAYLDPQYDPEIEDDTSSSPLPRWLSGNRAAESSTSLSDEEKLLEKSSVCSDSNSWLTMSTSEKNDDQETSVVEYTSEKSGNHGGGTDFGRKAVRRGSRGDAKTPKSGRNDHPSVNASTGGRGDAVVEMDPGNPQYTRT